MRRALQKGLESGKMLQLNDAPELRPNDGRRDQLVRSTVMNTMYTQTYISPPGHAPMFASPYTVFALFFVDEHIGERDLLH